MDKKKPTSTKKPTTTAKSQQKPVVTKQNLLVPKISITLPKSQDIERIKKQGSNAKAVPTLAHVPTLTSSARTSRPDLACRASQEPRAAETLNTARRTSTTVNVMSPIASNTDQSDIVENSRARRRTNMVQDSLLIWVDATINESDDAYYEIIRRLRTVINFFNIFNDVDECIDFVKTSKVNKIFIIASNTAGERIIPEIHDMRELDSCYILTRNVGRWAEKWPKVKGVYRNIELLWQALKSSLIHNEHNTVPISYLPNINDLSLRNLNELDPSFMYTTVLKEILSEIDFDEKTMEEFIVYCRQKFANNKCQIDSILKFESKYRQGTPIWWYTQESFLYSMLNRALRLMDTETIVKMGFFISDLHRQLQDLHTKQIYEKHRTSQFIVYRGQSLSREDFINIKRSKGGLLSFNNFLSTSKNYNVCLNFMLNTPSNSDMVEVIFVMEIDPTISSTPFAHITEHSYYPTENEVLFSMHTVFRIEDIEQLPDNNSFWQIRLTLTSNGDQELMLLTDRLREETEGSNGWHRLGRLLLKLNQFKQAEKVYQMILKKTGDDAGKATVCHQLGLCKESNAEYAEALCYYEQSLEYLREILSPDDPTLAISYNNVGTTYECMGDYSSALESHEKALKIRQQSLPANHIDLAQSYNSLGALYYQLNEYQMSLRFYLEALDIFQQTHPQNHPDLATIYNNIGNAYDNLGEHKEARQNYEKALEIDSRALPSDHLDLAISYNNFGLLSKNVGEFSEALTWYEKALEIYEKNLEPNHPDLATCYSNIGDLYDTMGEHSKAISYNERAVNIAQQVLPDNHPHLLQSKRNLEAVQRRRSTIDQEDNS